MFSAWFACNSSNCNSSCSICRSSFSEERAELQAPQLGDQQLQVLDLGLARSQLLALRMDLRALRRDLRLLREDQDLEFVRMECVEIGECVIRGSHCPESSRLLLQQNKNGRENKNYFAHTAICGA